MFSKNAEGSDVMWGQLAFDIESLGTLQRCNPKVSLLINVVALFLDDDHSNSFDETERLSNDHEQCELALLLP